MRRSGMTKQITPPTAAKRHIPVSYTHLAALILSEFELYRSSPAEYGSPKLMLSPLSIYPTATVGEMEREDGPITVAVMNGSHYAVGGGRALLAAMKEKPQTVRAYLADGAGSACLLYTSYSFCKNI